MSFPWKIAVATQFTQFSAYSASPSPLNQINLLLTSFNLTPVSIHILHSTAFNDHLYILLCIIKVSSMAHSITHQPGPSLPFPAAARTNPLGFSFGISSFSPHASPSLPSQQSPSGAGGSGSGFTFPRPAQPSPIGFGFSQNNSHNHASSSTPLARQGSSTSARPLPYTSSPVKKKRSRQSSLSSTSSSPTSAWATLPSPKALGQSKGLLDVGGMALDDGDRRKVVRRNMKRIRQEGATSVSQADNVDLGVLLGMP